MKKMCLLALISGFIFSDGIQAYSASFMHHKKQRVQAIARIHSPTPPSIQNLKRRYESSVLCSSTQNYDSNEFVGVVQRLNLTQQFERWKFLQDLLEGEVEHEEVNELLHSVLKAYLTLDPTQRPSDESAPLLDETDVMTINLLLSKGVNYIPVLQDGCKVSISDVSILSNLESILPDPSENKDVFQGLWDHVIELHGRESLKINQESRCKDWEARCIVARVLIWFEFLSEGVIDTPFE